MKWEIKSKLFVAFLDLSNLRIEPSLSPTEGEIVTLWPFQTRKLGLGEGTAPQCSSAMKHLSAVQRNTALDCCSDHSKVVKWEIVWAEFDRRGHLPSISVHCKERFDTLQQTALDAWWCIIVKLHAAESRDAMIDHMISCRKWETSNYFDQHIDFCRSTLFRSQLGPAELVHQLGLGLGA